MNVRKVRKLSAIGLATLAVVTSPLILGQVQEKSGGGQSGEVEKTLMQIEQELTAALLKGDATPFERHLADTFILTDYVGAVWDKGLVIARVKSGEVKWESSKVDEAKVQVYGNAAVVTYRSTDKLSLKGQDISGQSRWTSVYVRRGARWQVVASQATPIAQQ